MTTDLIEFYIRLVEDLERLQAAAASSHKRTDIVLWSEIIEAKEELANRGYVYLDGHQRPSRLVPAISKCSRCGMRITAAKRCEHT